ncbi:ABC transporter substrate-binding protein [Aliamphritea hakodatensis]|uniref:ABC transporter substrate-binding protein n=1 Tax=Aliamphritea hakodatensis TaxID=2895352 RepID=UPI0022FD8C48|nr:ABC transporter substrate-binding protein [Aliamphritea hakodatensis]
MKKILAFALIMFSQQALAEKVTLMLDWFVNPDHGPIIVAKQQGLFKAQGLDIEITEPADPSTPPKLVAAGKFDLAVTYQPQLIRDVVEDLPLSRVSTLIATPLNTVMVLKDKGYTSLADLEGKKIGYAFDGGLVDATIGTMMKKNGASIDNVELINVGWSLSASLATGKVDAIYGGYRNFEMHQLSMEGFEGKAFFVEEEGIPPYDELVVVANSNKIDKDMLKKFNRALELATQFTVNHPDEAWELFKSYGDGNKLDTELNRLAWKDTLIRFALRPQAADLGRYDNYAQFLFDNGVIKTLPKATDYIVQ